MPKSDPQRKRTGLSPARLSVEIRDDQFDSLARYVPDRVKTQLIQAVLDDLIHLLEFTSKHRNAALGALISKELRLLDKYRLEESNGSQ